MTVYIVTNRYGTEMGEPKIYKTKEDAENYVVSEIYNAVLEEVCDEAEEADIDTNDIDTFLDWASENDYCTSYNCDCIDTCTVGDDWYEFKITEVDLDTAIQ